MNSLPLISVGTRRRKFRRVSAVGTRVKRVFSPLLNKGRSAFSRMWRNRRHRQVFLAASGLGSVALVAFLVITFWPTTPNQFNTNPLRPGYRSAQLPAADILVEAQTTGSPRFTLTRNDSSFEFRVPGESSILTKDEGTTLTYRNKANQEVQYSLQNNGIKEEIKLFEEPESNTFSTQIRVNNVFLRAAPNGALYFFDKDDQEYQFHIEAPFAQDAAGDTTWGVRYQLIDSNGTDLLAYTEEDVTREVYSLRDIPVEADYELVVEVNKEWLGSRHRKYPIIIDPTVVHDTTSEFSSGTFARTLDSGSGSSPRLQSAAQGQSRDTRTTALWHLEETGSSMTDSSGNAHTGTATNTTQVTGKFGNGRDFNGSTSYVSIADNDAFSLMSTGEITLSAWINPDAIAGGSRTFILTKGTTSNFEWSLGLSSTGAPSCEQWTLAGANTLAVSATGSVATGKWQHIACTITTGKQMQVFLDGQLVASTETSSGSIGNGTSAVNIGRRGDNAETEFDGKIDEVRIDSVVRSAEEIAAIASLRPSATYTSPVIDLTTITSYDDFSWTELGVATGDGETLADATSLLAQWNYNNTSGTTSTNNAGSCGATCNGTLTSFASTGSQDAAVRTGWTSTNLRWGAGSLMFDGSDDYITASGINVANSSFTFESWAKRNSNGTIDYLMSQGTAATNTALHIGFRDDNTFICAFYANDLVSTQKYTDTDWHHWACTYDASTNARALYRDGALIASDTASADYSGSGTLYIGKYLAFADLFDGVMDSTRFYSRALSASEIASNAQVGNVQLQTRSSADGSSWEAWKPTTNEAALLALDSDAANWSWDNTATYAPVSKGNDTVIKTEGTSSLKLQTGASYVASGIYAHWPLDESGGTGAYLQDVSGNNRDITPTNGPTVAQGISRKARRFDGSNDYLTGNHGVAGNTSVVDFWFRTTSTTRAPLFWVSDTAPLSISSHVPAITMLANGTIRGEMWTGSVGAITSSKSYNDGKWHHVLLGGTGSTQSLIIDGETIGSRAGTIAQTWWTHTTIGAGYDSTARGASADGWAYFTGDIDEVRVANTVLPTEAGYEAYRMTSNHTLQRTISSTDLSAKDSLPFYVASDRPGTYLEATLGESGYHNNFIDSNVVAAWNLEEQGGSSAYIRDVSSNALNLTPTGTTFTRGKIGQGRLLNGSTDQLSIADNALLDPTAITVEAWIKPASLHVGNFINKGDNSGYRLRTNTNGTFTFFDRGGTNNISTSTASPYVANQWYHVAATANSSGLRIYVNGQLAASNATAYGSPNTASAFSIGAYSSEYFSGVVDKVRVSNIARSADEIRQSYESGLRSYPITIEFGASLDSGNLITGSGDTSFTIDATTRGLSTKGSKIYANEKIIVRENYNGTEYIAQASVSTVNSSTGAITTAAWDAGSTFPSGGFTVNADVFKWQREFWDVTRPLDSHMNAAVTLNLRVTDGNEGRTVWLDDLRSVSDYLTAPASSPSTSTAQRYFQYRAFFTSSSQVSPQLSSVSFEYTQFSVSETPLFSADSLHDKVKMIDTTPAISFVGTQNDSLDLVYQIEWDDDADFVGASVATSDASAGFLNLDNGGDTSPFTEGDTIQYTWQSALTNGNTYFYRVRSKAPAGTNTYGSWSDVRSLTIDTSLINDGWFETHADQFATDDLEANIEVDNTGNFVYIDPTGAPAFSRPITITNSGSLLTNHHTLLTIDTATLIGASKVQADCDDLRFYDTSDSLLTYWIENGCNTSTTKIWVQVPSLPNGDTIITMYYGDATASAGGASYSGNVISGFDGTCPGGWTALTTLNSGNYYLRGGTAAVGTTGGASTHTHSASLTTGTPSSTENTHSGGWPGSSPTHTHSATVTTASSGSAPPYYDLVYCQASGIPTSLTTSFMGLFPSTPAGWTRFTALDNAFPRANTTAGGTGGSATHTHSVSGTFGSGATRGVDESISAGDFIARGDHTHTFSTTSQSASSLPAYLTTVYAKPNSTDTLEDGQIVMMSSNTTPPLGWTRYTSLDDKFAYGSATSGTTGGSDTHINAISSFSTNSASGQINLESYTTDVATQNHSHTVNAADTASGSTLPPYYTVSYYQRQTDSTTKSVGTEVSSLRRLMISTSITAANITTARWNELTFADDTTDGNITYRLYYDVAGIPTLVPDADLTGNTAGFGSSPVDLSSLSVADYPILYLGADIFYSGGSPELQSWGVTFNEPPETPTLLAPSNGADLTSLSPAFQISTTDSESDYLRYKIEMCTVATMDAGCQTFDQTVSQTNWSGQNAETSTAYTSGSTATYTFPTQLPINTTYYWRATAIDPGGADWWSGTQDPVWSFTTPNLVRPQVCLLEESKDDDSIIIRWDDPNIVETGYEVERNLSAAGFSAFSTTAANVTSDTDNSVSPDNSYQYRIRALLGASTTDWCTTPLLQIETGSLLLEGVRGEGLRID